jgi:hypothetical protein
VTKLESAIITLDAAMWRVSERPDETGSARAAWDVVKAVLKESHRDRWEATYNAALQGSLANENNRPRCGETAEDVIDTFHVAASRQADRAHGKLVP